MDNISQIIYNVLVTSYLTEYQANIKENTKLLDRERKELVKLLGNEELSPMHKSTANSSFIEN